MATRGDAVAVLESAVEAARAAGKPVTGWMMQSSEDGYVAWLYLEDDDGQHSLFESVEILPSPLAAAEWCLTQLSEE